MSFPFKIGFGFDVHQLIEGRDFFLGGVKVEHTKGALGHSDADVLLHAICDALLGAAALGDIGVHFPDTNNEFKGIDSKILLERTVKLIESKGFLIGNIDCALCLEKPKIKPYVPKMQAVIANILKVEPSDVSIKATTNEKMGFIGREEGLVAYCTALIYHKDIKLNLS
jgi:2-C-methyl-D-erythritol 2,4-cyclodiphosphate synthase